MSAFRMIGYARPDLAREGYKTVLTKAANIILDNGGVVTKLNNWGVQPLAQPLRINRTWQTHGQWFDVHYFGNSKIISDMDTEFKYDDDVLRYMTLRQPGLSRDLLRGFTHIERRELGLALPGDEKLSDDLPCFTCGVEGHTAMDCTHRCIGCGEPGHSSKECESSFLDFVWKETPKKEEL